MANELKKTTTTANHAEINGFKTTDSPHKPKLMVVSCM